MMKFWIALILLVLFLGFCVFCYNFRTDYNVDAINKENKKLFKEIDILSYSLSIIPKELKNEVFFNSVKEKFPDVEEHKEILSVIKIMDDKIVVDVSESVFDKTILDIVDKMI